MFSTGDFRVRALRTVIDALAQAGMRGVLARGWGGLQPGVVPSPLHLIDEAAQGRPLPLIAAVVHHGGAGTTAARLRAGRPSVICPFFRDQPFWGRLVHEAGLGQAPLPQRRLSTARLAAAMNEAVHSDAICLAAAEMGRRLSAEDGVAVPLSVQGRQAGTTPSPQAEKRAWA